ncbi:NAD(P)/FAD-dependent oxidoreductase [Pelagicoccus mobilis]|uniref:NADH:ubiquinone reductase (non-electrogenic) n=1 Tax=Pelagicoccus mobilis TaxID=415221 RepID=A0A934VPQ1_9BACT|nr:NAD(P)/FAD-dependent oxidoreductase [Pelagicoccus mobilis]MBK1877522.1 NAD(P)/FAD-dependent oxidoreductase [Pelagicoccus mobilis]
MKKTKVLVLGAGFAGIEFCKRIDGRKFDVTLVDRQNHHLFQPLLYQVASSGLAVPEIAQPIRGILSGVKGLRILMDEVTAIDLKRRTVTCAKRNLDYDYLVIAVGAVTSYFGNDHWEAHAPGLKTVKDATRIRQSVLYAYEKAEATEDLAERQKLLTTVVVGAGPTGVELAGSFSELARHCLAKDFHEIEAKNSRVVLVEAADRVLAHMDPDLSQAALHQLEQLGVEVRLKTRVLDIRRNEIELEGETLQAGNIVWAAGVQAHPLTSTLGVELDRGGRIPTLPDLSLEGHPEVFALGDIVSLVDTNGVRVPGVSPAAIQMAQHLAKLLNRDKGKQDANRRDPFMYWDKGTMATVGRSRAVAQVARLKLKGFPAWLAWLFVHLVFLVGFRNKTTVLFHWVYSYLTYKKGARIIHAREDIAPELEKSD